MNDEQQTESERRETPPTMLVTAEDFKNVKVDEPISTVPSVDCSELADLYSDAAKTAIEVEDAERHRVYSLLSAVCSFHFRSNEPNEPFGPITQFGGSRSAIPDDLRGDPENALYLHRGVFGNFAVSARINDTLWLLDRSRAECARTALEGYARLVEAVRDGKATFRSKKTSALTFECCDVLRRALQIARAIGWDKEESQSIRQLVTSLREAAVYDNNANAYRRLAKLDLDFSVSEPQDIAAEAEALVQHDSNSHGKHELYHLAGRGYGKANVEDERNRCLGLAAETLVTVSTTSASAMVRAHWLEKAIAELHRVPKTQERRQALKHELIDIQTQIRDELQPISSDLDISEIVNQAEILVSGQCLMESLRTFVQLSFSPPPEKLQNDAQALIAESPLQSFISTTVMDTEGKPVQKYPGVAGGEDGHAVALQQRIAQSESIRRSLVAQGSIEPARVTVMMEHHVGENDLALICHHSPFVPPGHETVYTTGFVRFFQGDMISALHTLVPQLENSVRHILRSHGHDVVKFNSDMTQEDRNLSSILGSVLN